MINFRMEMYREVCNALERLYERSADAAANGTPPAAAASADALHSMSAADANFQVIYVYLDLFDSIVTSYTLHTVRNAVFLKGAGADNLLAPRQFISMAQVISRTMLKYFCFLII